jgi:hypothetical protein
MQGLLHSRTVSSHMEMRTSKLTTSLAGAIELQKNSIKMRLKCSQYLTGAAVGLGEGATVGTAVGAGVTPIRGVTSPMSRNSHEPGPCSASTVLPAMYARGFAADAAAFGVVAGAAGAAGAGSASLLSFAAVPLALAAAGTCCVLKQCLYACQCCTLHMLASSLRTCLLLSNECEAYASNAATALTYTYTSLRYYGRWHFGVHSM